MSALANIAYTAEEVIYAVSEITGHAPEMLLGARQTQDVTRCRHIGFAICQEDFGMSTTQVGRAFKRDHTTVMAGIRKFKERCEADPTWGQIRQKAAKVALENLEKRIGGENATN